MQTVINRLTLVIEGDATVDPSALRVVVPTEIGLDVLYTARDDGLAPEPLDVDIAPDWIARIAMSIELARVAVDLKKYIQEKLDEVAAALDKAEADPDAALKALADMERQIRAARARVLGAKSLKKDC